MSSSDDLSGPYGKVHKCPEKGCNASYSKLSYLKIHERKHTGERPCICDVGDCKKAYSNASHLKRHKYQTHENAYEILCSVTGCGKVFSNKYNLKRHTIQQHTESSNIYRCAQCLEGFKKKYQLKRHLYLHQGTDALKCSSCNISFGSLHLYNKHKRNHKSYACDCGMVFERWSMFCKHRKTACSIKKIDHKCIICNKVFKTRLNLKNHSLTHLEESQIDVHHCPYLDCKRSYKYKKNLLCHIKVYHERQNDEVKIQCTEPGCNSVLKSKKNLKQHIFNIHKRQPGVSKPRKPRKDKNKKKKCMASIISGVPLSSSEHLAIINNSTSSNDCTPHIDSTKLTGIYIDIEKTCKETTPTKQSGDTDLSEQNKESEERINTTQNSIINIEVIFNEELVGTLGDFTTVSLSDDTLVTTSLQGVTEESL